MRAGFIAKRDAVHSVQPVHALLRQRAQQLGERDLAFAGDDDVGAGVEIFGDVVGALGAAEHDGPAMQLRGPDDAQHVAARHEVGVDADHAAGRGRERCLERGELRRTCCRTPRPRIRALLRNAER